MEKSGKSLVQIGHIEGISYLILLFIAMPLKYYFDMPMAVRIMGSIHGVLFILFCAILWSAYKKIPFSTIVATKIFILSLVPFGTFFIKGMLPKEADQIHI